MNPQVKSQPTQEELIAKLIAENEALKAAAAKKKKDGYNLSLKIANKGGVSMYGMGRFPVTLYPEQWLALLEFQDSLKAFLATNEPAIKERQANPIIVAPMVVTK